MILPPFGSWSFPRGSRQDAAPAAPSAASGGGARAVGDLADPEMGYFYGIFFWDISMGYFYGIFLLDIFMGYFYGIFLWDIFMGYFFMGFLLDFYGILMGYIWFIHL